MDVQFHLTHYQTVISVEEITVKWQEKLKNCYFREPGLLLLVLSIMHIWLCDKKLLVILSFWVATTNKLLVGCQMLISDVILSIFSGIFFWLMLLWLINPLIAWKSNLVPMLEDLFSSNPYRSEFSGFWVLAGIELTTSGLTVPRSDHCYFRKK